MLNQKYMNLGLVPMAMRKKTPELHLTPKSLTPTTQIV